MSLLERAGLAALRRIDPETAHGLALKALRAGLGPKPGPITSDLLKTRIGTLALPNPVGLAAGFDKNATALGPLTRAGFGMVEIGAVTPRPQPGNPRPRLFRLPQHGAVINRFGFNNDGMEAVAARIDTQKSPVARGVNLGANKDSADRAQDYCDVLACLGPLLDFATVNISSPNTERLRDLQGAAALDALLGRVMETNAGLGRPLPILLKIAPDLTDADLERIAASARQHGIAAIVATNTTTDRSAVAGPNASEAGGLSGRPLFDRSTRVLARLYGLTDTPLIGVGGISSAENAYAKIMAGASAVQLYTALAYCGLGLVQDIASGLERLLERDGHPSVAHAVGTRTKDWT